MKAVVQRVNRARVRVEGRTTGEIGAGLMILLGVGIGDTEDDARLLADKCINLRIFENPLGKIDRSVLDVGGECLVVSQFTLFADCAKGRRPSFTGAAPPEAAETQYLRFVDFIRERGLKVDTGVFGAHMDVEIHNDGPVTLILDSRKIG
jgi:D-tyrosyl-tRNA(Tyr) deacylase